MKNFILAAAFLILGQKPNAQLSPPISKLQWVVGTWKLTNAKPGRSGVEIWKVEGNELIGRGINMKGTDTAFVEKIRIVEKDGRLFYLADVPENKSEVGFRLTTVADGEFVCENPAHDFPKRIHYKLTGTKLTATVSGNGKAIAYLFERAQ